MTLLIAALVTGCCVLVSSIGLSVAGRAEARTRAQTAADAAALAAIAEALPYGTGQHRRLAERFAALNGARLTECRCASGSVRVEVTVEMDGVTARAAADLDAGLLVPMPGVSVEGLHPQLAAAVDQLIAASQGSVHLVSGYRSTERQAQLWSDALVKYGSAEAADDWVAPPGHSMHERGLAVDLGGDLERAAYLVDGLGLPLHRPLVHEPWHFELMGSR